MIVQYTSIYLGLKIARPILAFDWAASGYDVVRLKGVIGKS